MTSSARTGAFHRLTIVPMIAALGNLGRILAKAEAHAVGNGVVPAHLLQQRLYPDMFSLIQQLQYALYLPCDFARHFAESEPPRAGYDEASFADVQASLKRVTDYLGTISASRMDELAELVVPSFFDPKQGVASEAYAASVTMPDFYFHLSIAYAILRHNGVPLAKADFLGAISSVPLN